MDVSDANCYPEALIQIQSQFLRKVLGPRRHDIHILLHSWLIDVRAHRLSTKHNGASPAAKEFKNCIMNCRQPQRLAHCEFLKCKGTIPEHV